MRVNSLSFDALLLASHSINGVAPAERPAAARRGLAQLAQRMVGGIRVRLTPALELQPNIGINFAGAGICAAESP